MVCAGQEPGGRVGAAIGEERAALHGSRRRRSGTQTGHPVEKVYGVLKIDTLVIVRITRELTVRRRPAREQEIQDIVDITEESGDRSVVVAVTPDKITGCQVDLTSGQTQVRRQNVTSARRLDQVVQRDEPAGKRQISSEVDRVRPGRDRRIRFERHLHQVGEGSSGGNCRDPEGR